MSIVAHASNYSTVSRYGSWSILATPATSIDRSFSFFPSLGLKPAMLSFPLHSFSFYFFLSSAALVVAQYSIYQPKNQVIFGGAALHLTATGTAAAANFTGAAAYDSTVLTPPAVPNPAIPSQIPIQLTSSGGITGLSIPQNGGFFGFSIEMSVSNQVCESSCYSS
jgi:hypothetical protein